MTVTPARAITPKSSAGSAMAVVVAISSRAPVAKGMAICRMDEENANEAVWSQQSSDPTPSAGGSERT